MSVALAAETGTGSALGKRMTNQSNYVIVVGVDYSEVSRLALREALNLAAAHAGSQVHVVHVETVTPPLRSGLTDEVLEVWPVDPPLIKSRVDAALGRLHRVLTEEVKGFEQAQDGPARTSIDRVVSHVRLNAPGREIAQLASDLEADLVVVGTHGRSAIARALLGSVAHAVVNLAPCPVLVVRSKRVSAAPAIEPPCPRCLEARRQSGGHELWCDQHRAHHGQRHTYHQGDRSAEETNFPLVFNEG